MLWIALLKRYLMWSFQHYEMGIFLHEDMRCGWRNLPTEESSSHSLAPAGNSCTRPLHPPPAPKPPRGLSPGPLTLTCLGLGSPTSSQSSLTGTTPRDAAIGLGKANQILWPFLRPGWGGSTCSFPLTQPVVSTVPAGSCPRSAEQSPTSLGRHGARKAEKRRRPKPVIALCPQFQLCLGPALLLGVSVLRANKCLFKD